VKLFVGFHELSSRLSTRSDSLVTREHLGYALSTYSSVDLGTRERGIYFTDYVDIFCDASLP